jgi:tripartite-type tricarboxylate transporter receptor subunit TctC
MNSRGLSLIGAGVAMLVPLLDPWPASAQGWKPEKPVEIVIGASPGGPQDRTGRTIQRILQEQKLVTTPVNVSRAQIQFWDDALGRMVKTGEWTKQLVQFDMEAVYRNSADTERYSIPSVTGRRSRRK